MVNEYNDNMKDPFKYSGSLNEEGDINSIKSYLETLTDLIKLNQTRIETLEDYVYGNMQKVKPDRIQQRQKKGFR